MIISEDHFTFLYPDMKTALVGQFRNGVMIEGRPSKVIAERCHNGLKEISVAKPKRTAPIFSFKRNTKHHIYDAINMDPFEKNMVYVNKTTNAGDGLFAKKDVEANEVIAYYSGTVWTPIEHIDELSPANQTGYFR